MVDTFNMMVGRPWAATLAAGSTGTTPELALTDQPSERWVSPAGAGHIIRIDLGSSRLVNTAAVLYTSLYAGCTVSVRGSDDLSALPGSAALASMTVEADGFAAAADGYRHLFSQLSATARYWQLTVNKPSGDLREVVVGRVFLGEALQVEYNPDYGATSWGYEEAPEPDTLDGGATVLTELPAAPYFEFQMTWTTEAEMEAWWNAKFGPLQWRRQPVLVIRRPDLFTYRHAGIFWGVLRLQPFVAAQFDMFEVSGKIRSML